MSETEASNEAWQPPAEEEVPEPTPEAVEQETPEVETDAEPEYTLSEHAQRYLGDITQEVPEELHPHLEKALKRWDAGFTLKSQEWADERKAYAEYGTLDEIREAAQIRSLLATDPVSLYTWLEGRLAEANQLPKRQQVQASPEIDEDDDRYGERFSHYDRFQQQAVQLLTAMHEEIQGLKSQTSSASEKAELDGRLALVKTANPDVDIDFVRGEVDKGRTIDDAVSLYRSVYQSAVNRLGKQSPTPPVVPGSGNPPTLNGNIEDLSDEEHDQLVVQALTKLMSDS